jgi:hypothetical protein
MGPICQHGLHGVGAWSTDCFVFLKSHTFSFQNYMCADCAPCEPTCTSQRNYCACLKVAGISNLWYVIAPAAPGSCSNGTLVSGLASSTPSAPAANGTSRSAAVAPLSVPVTVAMSSPSRRRAPARFVKK